MVPKPETPRGAEARQRILAAAAEVFAEHGFTGAGVDAIAARAGVNKAMLYYHVGDKASLYAAVVLGFSDQVRAEIRERLAAAPDPISRLRALQSAFMAVALREPHFPQVMLREIAAGGANLPPEVLSRMAEIMAVTRDLVVEGQAGGDFRLVNPLVTHILVVGSVILLTNVLRLRERLVAVGAPLPETPPDPRAMGELVTDILLFGIAAREPLGGVQ